MIGDMNIVVLIAMLIAILIAMLVFMASMNSDTLSLDGCRCSYG